MNQRRFNVWQAMLGCWYSKPLYYDVAVNWRRSAHGYLLLVLLICWIPVWAAGWIAYRQIGERSMGRVARQVPWLNIYAGELTVKEAQDDKPYVICRPYAGTPIAVVDTSGTFTSLHQTTAYLLATRDRLHLRWGGNQFQMNWPQWLSLQVGLDRMRFAGYVGRRVWIPVTYSASFFYRAAQNLFYALGAVLIARLLGLSITYRAARRLAIVAVTPSIVLSSAWFLLACPWPKFWLVGSAVLTLGYLCFGLLAASNPQVAMAMEQTARSTSPQLTNDGDECDSADQADPLPDAAPALS